MKGGRKSLTDKEVAASLSTLLAQRIDLLCQDRRVHQQHATESHGVRAEAHAADTVLQRTIRHFHTATANLQRAHRETGDRQADLAVLQQELSYLTEELGLYLFEKDSSSPRVSVSQAFRCLSSQQNPETALPLRANDPPKRLAWIEDTLKGMKRTGSEQIRKVDDGHDQVHWHVSRRGDILRDMVRQFMRDNALRRMDTKLWRVLQAQQVIFLKLNFLAKNKVILLPNDHFQMTTRQVKSWQKIICTRPKKVKNLPIFCGQWSAGQLEKIPSKVLSGLHE